MAHVSAPRFQPARRGLGRPSLAALLSLVWLLFAVGAALVASGVVELPDVLDAGSNWRWGEGAIG